MPEHTFVHKIRKGARPDEIVASLRESLQTKIHQLVESMVKEQAAGLLQEADPKPKVELDINKNPVMPSAADYLKYFERMHLSHVVTQRHRAEKRWNRLTAKAAAASKKASAEPTPYYLRVAKYDNARVKALRSEIDAAGKVIASKTATEKDQDSTGKQKSTAKDKSSKSDSK
jgi:hypothetical protein